MAKRKKKRKRQGHPARISPLRAIDGGQKSVPLEGRPEYEAHMAAWRAAGSPRPRR